MKDIVIKQFQAENEKLQAKCSPLENKVVALLKKKKLSNINNNKFNLNAETKLYINENLTPMNESSAFKCRKLKRSNIHACYAREGIVQIKQEERSKPFKIFDISTLHDLFLDFVFVDDEKVVLTPLFYQAID